ncbi:hypothetical protein F5Y14DRAFT_283008 [Nemania sp. NC0429]|nr:hypothetical protein F5Y14DRAFT_283008 [Nemania sp. NC0429]
MAPTMEPNKAFVSKGLILETPSINRVTKAANTFFTHPAIRNETHSHIPLHPIRYRHLRRAALTPVTMCKTHLPCGCISLCTTEVVVGLTARDMIKGCPIFLNMCHHIELANIISNRVSEFNVYVDQEENLIDRAAYLDDLKSKEREFLAVNEIMRNYMIHLDSASWDALVNRDGFCLLFENVFGWNPTEIAEKRPNCQEKHS